MSNRKFEIVNQVNNTGYALGNKGKLHFAKVKNNALMINEKTSIQSVRVTGGYVGVYEQNGLYGLWWNRRDSWLFEGKLTAAIFDEVIEHNLRFKNQFLVKYKGKYGLATEKGNFVIQPIYSHIIHSHGSVVYFKNENDWYRYDYGYELKKETGQAIERLDAQLGI